MNQSFNAGTMSDIEQLYLETGRGEEFGAERPS